MRFVIRWLRWLAAFIVVSVITSLLTMGTTALVVDQYLQTTIQQFQLPIEKKPLTVMTLWGSLWSGSKSKSEQPAGTSVDGLGGRETVQQSEQPNNRKEITDSQSSEQGGSTSSEAAVPVWGGNIDESAEAGNRVLVTPEDVVEGKDKLTEQTKEKLFSTLMKKLPADDWQRISTLMEEGLTATELIEMEQILAKHLNDEEYKQMREILTGSSKQTQQAQANESGISDTSNRKSDEQQ